MSTEINIDKPRYDQTTYIGRAKHFLTITNPLNVLSSHEELEKAKQIVYDYKQGHAPPDLSEDALWKAKNLYDSAFHPDTGEKMLFLGRMSFQVPGNMFLCGGMLTFYKSTPAVVFWQWLNQTFNAVVNYTNRSGSNPISYERLGASYCLATTGAVSTALLINRQVKRLPPLVGRCVPFVAVAAANCINIPFMRSAEITEGITLLDEHGVEIGHSSAAAKLAIAQVVFSRVCMSIPSMVFPPIVMDQLDKAGVLARYKWIGWPLQVLLCGVCITFATPLCCALFPQRSSIAFSSLEHDVQEKIKSKGYNDLNRVYFNKGL